ncbi:MAG: hypothetical protein IJF20_01045 [Clostridia bacterium]|nr:hypothetical protein [Clostridia bacterium]
MFTVIIQSKRSSDLMKDYKFLFKPFVDDGLISFCDWNESGTDVRSSVPDLYNVVKGKKEWRALILNTDSVYDYKGVLCPDRRNPFDYSDVDSEELPHESPVPIIRLTHIIGGYASAQTKEFEKAFEYIDEESGEKIRLRESELTDDEIHQLSIDHYDTLTSVYMEKDEDPERARLQEKMVEKYSFTDIRPSEIMLVATKKKVEDNEKARIVESWKNHLEMTSSSFWERNKYPNNCRFLFYDITNTDNSMYQKELTEFWLSVLTLATNKIAASTLQAYRLYRLHIDVSNEELAKLLNAHLNKMNSAYAFIKEQLKLRPEYSFDEDEDVVKRQTIPVTIENCDERDLFMNFRNVGLCRDCPDDENAFWVTELRRKKDSLDKYLKSPRRAINKSANRLKFKTESFVGETYELDRFQIEDVKEIMDDLENKIMSSGVENVVDKKKIDEEIVKVDKKVRKEISFRMRKNTAIIGGLIILSIIFAGFIPYLIQCAGISEKNLFAGLGLVLGVLVLSACGGLVALFIQRKHIVSVMKSFNTLMRNVANKVRTYASKFETYFSDICTFMKARSILDGINTNKENAFSKYSLLNVHKLALQAAIGRDNEWLSSYGVQRVDEMIPAVTSFFKTEEIPKENSLYYFTVNYDENDIPINSTGDYVTAPYKFVEKLWIEREDLFDEEEAKA